MTEGLIEKKFSWMGLFFGPYYYVGYGARLQGYLMGVFAWFPLFALCIYPYCGFKATQHLPIGQQSFQWLSLIPLFLIQFGLVIATLSFVQGG
ncbi:MAG: hypothetical protein HWE34_05535 [Methylocystaceae bacterium]|nr:hypothetical protein [Methylocystaceae bacterium]